MTVSGAKSKEIVRTPMYYVARDWALELLSEFDVESPPVPIVRILKHRGFDVVKADLPGNMAREVSGYIDFERKKVVINADDPPNRQRFTLAHELGHLVMHESEIQDDPNFGVILRRSVDQLDTDALEKEANCFAANLLVPFSLFAEYENKSDSEIARVFRVSEEVIKYRRKGLRAPF